MSSKNLTVVEGLINGLLVLANDKVLKDPIAVGEPPSDLVLI